MVHFVLPVAYILSSVLLLLILARLVPRCRDPQVAEELRFNTIIHVVSSGLISAAYLFVAVWGVH